MLFLVRGDFNRVTLLGRVHGIGDVGALGEARRLAAQTVPRAARQTRRKRPERERQTRAGREPASGEASALPPRRRPPHHDEGRLAGVALLTPASACTVLIELGLTVARRCPAQRL